MVRIPKAVFDDYWPLPWVELIAAAEDHRDGLRLEGPPATPWPWNDGGPQRSTFMQGPDGDRLFAERNEKYERGKDAAYMREGDGAWGKNKSCLYQQNW